MQLRGGKGRRGTGSERAAVAGQPCPPVPGRHPSQTVQVAGEAFVPTRLKKSLRRGAAKTQRREFYFGSSLRLCASASPRLYLVVGMNGVFAIDSMDGLSKLS